MNTKSFTFAPALILAAFLLTLGTSSSAHAQDTKWVEAKLVSYDEMQILYGTAEQLIAAGKIEGARAALLASANGVQQALPKAHLPAVAAQIQAYEKLAPIAYKDFEYAGDSAAFKALIAEHEPGLVELAAQVSLPPVGKSFENPLDRVTRVLAAKESLADAAEAAKAYAAVAPGLEAHLQLKESQKVTEALRQIMFAALSTPGHIKLATETATKQAADFKEKVDNAVKRESVSMISSWADQEIEYGELLKKLGQEELGQEHLDHAQKALEVEKELRKKQLEKNRVPNNNYSGKDEKKLRKLVKKEFSKQFPKDKILEVRFSAPDFTERRMWVKVDENTWAWRVVRRYEWAYIVYQPKGGDKNSAYVYPMRIEQQWHGSKLGNYYTYRPGHIYGYEMLKKNL